MNALATSLTLVCMQGDAQSRPAAPAAAPSLADKSAYTLFNPTPRDLMRELSADRPDVTESPYTVDAGHAQFELSFIDYVREGRIDDFTILPTNFKIGLLNNLDVQLVVEPFIHKDQERSIGGFDSDSGFGDTLVRMKMNLWGNDRGKSAAAIMPFIKLPTASANLGNDHVEGGLTFPFAFEIGGGWAFGLMPEFDIVFDDDDDDYDLEFLHTATVGHDLVGALAGYIEYIGILSTDSASEYPALVGLGITCGLGPDVQLDAGINIGLTDAADDLNPFIGMTVRF